MGRCVPTLAALPDLIRHGPAVMKKARETDLGKSPELLEEALGILMSGRYFHTMDADLLREVLRKGVYVEAPPGTQLMKEDGLDDDVYFLLEGSLAVTSNAKLILHLNTPGDIAGEFAVVSSAPRSADVSTDAPSRLVRVSSAIVKTDYRKDPERAAQFLAVFGHIMAGKLRETSQRAKLYEDAVLEAREIASSHAELESEIDDKLQEILLYSRVIESSNDAVVITDTDNRIIRSNPAAVKMFKPLANLRRRKRAPTIESLVKDFDLDNYPRHNIGEEWQGEWVHSNGDKPFTLQVTVTPINDKAGRLMSIAYQMRDISLQKEQERDIQRKSEEIHKALVDLEETYQELQRSDRLKTETLTVISNELTPPIRKVINHAAKLIQVGTDTSVEELQSNLMQIRDQGSYLKAIADNIDYLIDYQFDLSEIGTERIDLARLISTTVLDLQRRPRTSNVPVQLDLPKNELVLTGDDEKFKVLFNLLIEQAVLVAHRGNGVRIAGKLEPDADQLRIDITYDGPSLIALDPSRSNPSGGRLGLLVGLPMARKLISYYQGSIQFLGNAKQSHITILLPRTQREGDDRPNRVIIFDESEMDTIIMRGVIEHLWPGSVILETREPFDFLDNYEDFKPDLVVIDPHISEPGWNNHRIFAAMMQGRRHVCPILSVSGLYEDFAERTLAVERGVSDFLAKPYSIFDLRFKIKTLLQSHRREESLFLNMDQAQKQATTDGLTHLANRKHFDNFLETQIEYSRQTHKTCSLIMLDVDNFKHYNDTNGHQLGDEVLKGVARVLATSVRSSDLAARYGGEEFVVVLPETKKQMAAVIAEKMRRTIQETDFPKGADQPLGYLSASFGVASFPEDGASGEEILKAADDCLYRAKENGRNRVEMAPE